MATTIEWRFTGDKSHGRMIEHQATNIEHPHGTGRASGSKAETTYPEFVELVGAYLLKARKQSGRIIIEFND